MTAELRRDSLGDYFTLQRGTTYKSALLGLPGPILLGLATIQRHGGFRSDSLKSYGGESPDRLLVRPGDLYASLKDVTQAADLLGAVARLPQGYGFGRLTQDTVRLDPRSEDVPIEYLYWLMRTPRYRSYCRSRATGTTNLGLPREDFLSFPVPKPDLEKLRVAEVLTAIDDKIELNGRMSETLMAMARALFKSWFVDFDPVLAKTKDGGANLPQRVACLFPHEIITTQDGDAPSGWRFAPIGDLAVVVGGSTPKTDQPAFWRDGIHRWATPKDLAGLSVPVLLDTARRLSDSGLGQIGSGLLPKGTVLLSSRAPIGYLAITEVPVAINQGFIAMTPKQGMSNQFLLHWAHHSMDAIISRANGSTFLEISKANFRPIPVCVPPVGVMDAFDAIAGGMYQRMVACQREIRTLVDMRDTLLPHLLSGELRVDERATAVTRSAT